jgi:hypothetical protein
MKNELLNESIKLINRSFITLCLKADESELIELSIKLNCEISILRALRGLDYPSLERVYLTECFLLKPAVDNSTIERISTIETMEQRKLFVSSKTRSGNVRV